MTTWTLEDRAGGGVVVTWGRRRMRFGSTDEALKYIRKNRSDADRVIKVDKDGYRVPLTRHRWRKRGSDL